MINLYSRIWNRIIENKYVSSVFFFCCKRIDVAALLATTHISTQNVK
jgi:hypothetical protein